MNSIGLFSGLILATDHESLRRNKVTAGRLKTKLHVNPGCGKGKLLSTAYSTVLGLLAFTLCFFGPQVDSAMALQVHGPPEGLYVHQMAHVHYLIALVFFLWYIRRAAFAGRGWRYLQLFCLFMGLWNILAFAGHFAATRVEAEALVQSSHYLTTMLLPPFSANNLLFYMAKLDHLICAPALFCLFMAIRTFYRSAAAEQGESGQ